MDNLSKPHRNSHYESNKDVSVNEEVQKIFRKGKNNNQELNKLRDKYDDATFEKIQQKFMEQHHMISKKAKKFARLINEKYIAQNLPFHIILNKAKLFKSKYNLSEEEFAEFQRIYESELIGKDSNEILNITNNMTKVLGSITVDMPGFNYKLNDTDYKYLQEILKLYSNTASLHSQIVFQSMQYSDCDLLAINGEFKRELGHKPTDSIHPIIAALFLPKINVLESHFLHSNISRIIKIRYNGEVANNRADYELIHALTTDPNDIVCDQRSILSDLLNRAQIQVQLWNCVLNLRNGQYYNSSFRDFLSAVDMCRTNKQDTPDFIYGRYDGIVLKRLFSAFSFRPTIVHSSSGFGNGINMINNPYQQNIRPIVTHTSMITYNIPLNSDDNDELSLTSALKQDQLVLQRGVVLSTQTNIIYSRDVIFFYINRKQNSITVNGLQPFDITRLPLAIAGLDQLNDKYVEIPDSININEMDFDIKSVVIADVNKNMSLKNAIVGSSALIAHTDPSTEFGLNSDITYYIYDPVRINVTHPTTFEKITRQPVGVIDKEGGISNETMNFKDMASRRGIIFMYAVRNSTINNNNMPTHIPY